MNETLKTILLVSASVVLILIVFLGGYLLGRVSEPYHQAGMGYSMGWPMFSGTDCPHDRLPYRNLPGGGMFDEHHPGGGFYHQEGMPFWDQRDR